MCILCCWHGHQIRFLITDISPGHHALQVFLQHPQVPKIKTDFILLQFNWAQRFNNRCNIRTSQTHLVTFRTIKADSTLRKKQHFMIKTTSSISHLSLHWFGLLCLNDSLEVHYLSTCVFIFSPCRLSGHGSQQGQEAQEDLDPLCSPVKTRKNRNGETQNTWTLKHWTDCAGSEKLPPPPQSDHIHRKNTNIWVRLEGPEDPSATYLPPLTCFWVCMGTAVFSEATGFRRSLWTESSFRAFLLLFLPWIPLSCRKNLLGVQISVTRVHSCPLTTD